MNRWHYFYSGLHVVSDLPIPEWEIFSEPPLDAALQQTADVRFLLDEGGAKPIALEEEFLRVDERVCEFHVAEIARYRVRDGREIFISTEPDVAVGEVRLFLLGSAWGALCYQRGLFLLHASVLEVGGEAVAFCGASGMGKSTTAAWLIENGYPLISDDLCVCDFSSPEAPAVWPATQRMKLWSDSLQALKWDAKTLERDRFRYDKFHLARPQASSTANESNRPLRLRAIYLLEWGEARVSRLTGVSGLNRFIESATYRPEYLEPMKQMENHWTRCADLIRHVPLFEFRRPRDWSQMNDAVALLTAQWK